MHLMFAEQLETSLEQRFEFGILRAWNKCFAQDPIDRSMVSHLV